jgi:capsular exopolysaccharide synthesis family protein
MSHIFDALQRSEAERPEIDAVPPSEATELLRRAERRASSNWETAVPHPDNAPAGSAQRGASFGPRAAALAATVHDATALHGQISADRERDIFSQFQPLEITLLPQNRLVCLSDDETPAAEAIRLLGVRLRNLRRDRALKKILITSTVPQEGKSVVAANLACALALTTQQKILLIDGDLRRPSLSGKFGMARHSGLCECLKDERPLAACIYRLEQASLWFLPAGSTQSNALELLQSGQLPAIMERLAEWFDWIIIDSPPVLPLGDTSVWARVADGTLLVTRQGTTEKRHLMRGIEAIEPKKLIGALLNCSQISSDYHYYYTGGEGSRPSDRPVS